MPKPEQIFNIHEEEETYPQFQGVPSTTTATTSTITHTTTDTTTTTTVISTKDTTTSIIVEEVPEVENVVTSTISSIHDKEDLVEENTSKLTSLPTDSVETTLSSLVNDIEESDNEADIAPSTTEILNVPEGILQTGTTLPTVSEENDIDTVTPLVISQNAEEIIEIVEPFPSQQMDGPTPSIIIAEIVKPEEISITINNTTDETTSAQNELEKGTTTPQTEIISNEQVQQVVDLPDYTLLETNSEVEEATSTTKESTTLISDISVPTTVYPLLFDSFEEVDDSKTDMENTLAEEITESKTTISNIDGFHITISNPIKSESKTEAPLHVEEIQDTEILENSISNDTTEASGIDVLEEEEHSPTTIISTTDKTIDESTIVPFDIFDPDIPQPIIPSHGDEPLPISFEVAEQSTTPPETSTFEQGITNSLPTTTNIQENVQSEQIVDDDDYSERNSSMTDELGKNEIESNENNLDDSASLVTTTENSEEIDMDEILPVEETPIKNSDTVIAITKMPTTTEILDNEMLNKQNNLDTKLEVPDSTIPNLEDIEQADITSTMPSTIIQVLITCKI